MPPRGYRRRVTRLANTPRLSHPPSPYQAAIYEFARTGTGNAFVEAVAGSGKSTTLLGTLEWIPSSDTALCLAFNKSVKEHLVTMTPGHVTVQTLNGYGHSLLCREFRGTVFVDPNRDRAIVQNLLKELGRHPYRYPNFLITKTACALVSLHKANLATEVTSASVGEAIDEYDLDVPPGALRIITGLAAKLFEITTDRSRFDADRPVVSYDDQLWMPVMWNFDFRQYDWVLVDEAQDLNRAQIELVMRAVRPGGRIIAFGDRHQAMYAFRGADAYAVETLIQRMNAELLPLSICYRCAKNVVQVAKSFVPQIEASDDADPGIVTRIHTEPKCWDYLYNLSREDMVLCRTNAPLMEVAEQLVNRGQSVRMADKSYADKLLSLMAIADREGEGGSLNERLFTYVKNEVQRREKDELPVSWLIDRAKSLKPFFRHGATSDEIEDYIRTMFDSTEGPLFSTVHRAKGLEADRVFVLRPDLMPHPKVRPDSAQYVQELNLQYVAITRARRELYFLSGIKNTEERTADVTTPAYRAYQAEVVNDLNRVIGDIDPDQIGLDHDQDPEEDEAPF